MRQLICPVCKSHPSSPTNHLELVLCQKCSVTWLYLNEAIDTAALYEDEVYQVVDNRKSIFERIIFREAKTVLNTLKKLKINSTRPRVLDFGSGKGLFLEQTKLFGWQPYGIETSKARAAFAQKFYSVPVSTAMYSSGTIAGSPFDVISLFHVLEHLPEPLVLLDNLLTNLAKDGVVVLEVPNYKSWQASIAGRHWMHLDVPRHLSHWDEKLLTEQMGSLGYKKVKSQYFSIHLGVLGMLRSLLGLVGYRGNIIYDLKNRPKPTILFQISLILPLAFILELLSVPFRTSGIIRLYFKTA